MNHYLLSFVALDLARLRVEEAARQRYLSVAIEDRFSSSGSLRRSVARSLALVSRASASVVRRLDECVADDLGRSLAPTE